MDLTNEERLTALEATSLMQEAQIDSLVSGLADLLAAYAVQHNDLRLFSLLAESRDGYQKAHQSGGSERFAPKYFEERTNIICRLLEEACYSRVLDQFWFRRFFFRSEERQRKRLEKIRAAIEKKLHDNSL